MSMQLVVIAGPDKGHTFPLTPGEAIFIGRSQATQTRLADPRVSKVHCKLEVGDGRATLSDESSKGTRRDSVGIWVT